MSTVTPAPAPLSEQDRAWVRHHALADVAADADRRADATREAMDRTPPGYERECLRLRWDQLTRIAHSLRNAPGYIVREHTHD